MNPRVRTSADMLSAAKERRAAQRERVGRAFLDAARAPAPEPALRSDLDRVLRTLALGAAAACAFVPAAQLSDEAAGAPVPVARNVAAVLVLTLLPALSSALAERSPDAEDMPRARLLQRFSPLAPGILFVLTLFFPWFARWGAVQTALVLQAPLAAFLHVSRVRACHLLVVGWGGLASAVLDDRALPWLAASGALTIVAAALDRALEVRNAAGSRVPARLAVPLLGALAVVGTGAALLALALLALPAMERALPEAPKLVRATRQIAAQAPKRALAELALAACAVLALAVIWHRLAERLGRKRVQPLALPEVGPPDPTSPLEAGDVNIDPRWPAGPRLALVRRYVAHLRVLARFGVGRAPSETPREHARAIGARAPGVAEAATNLARAFHVARYSPETVDPEMVARADEDAKRIEGTVCGPRTTQP